MAQLHLYDFLPMEEDPLFMLISKIRKGEKIYVGDLEVELNNFGMYQICTEDFEVAQNSIESCYRYILSVIDEDTHGDQPKGSHQ